MKANFLILATISIKLIFQMGCLTPPASEIKHASYLSEQWPALMKGYSELDQNLGKFSDIDSSMAQFTHFQTFLHNNNVSKEFVQALTNILEISDEKMDRPAYHGLIHTARVGNLTASVLNDRGSSLSENQKIIFAVSALLHDIDPARKAGSSPRVSSTFIWMDNDKEIDRMFDILYREKNITKEQIKSVIKYTDFDLNPKKLAAIQMEAEQMTDRNFEKTSADVVKVWGRRIAYLDQVAMYIGSFEFAVQSVVGLANEFRSNNPQVNSPSDAAILSNTHKFLKTRIDDANFSILSKTMQKNLLNVYHQFEKVWAGKNFIN
jgi:hypothetical protein